MAAKKRRRRQGVASWLTSVLALGIGLSGVFTVLKSGGLRALAAKASFGTSEKQPFKLETGAIIYVPMFAGIVFKKVASELVRSARIQALLPRLG